jgi:hypothetical protein
MIEWFVRYVGSWLGLFFVMLAFTIFAVIWWALAELWDRFYCWCRRHH